MAQQLPDTRIPLSGLGGGGGGNRPNPLGTLGQMMQIKEQQLAYQQRQKEVEDDDETRYALQQYDRPDEAIDHLWKAGRGAAAGKLALSVFTERKARTDAAASQIKSHSDAMEQVAQIAHSITDDASLKVARPAMLALAQPMYGEGVEDLLPTTFDAAGQARLKQIAIGGTQRAQQLQKEHQDLMQLQDLQYKGLARYKDPDHPDAPARWSKAGLENQQEYQDMLVRRLTVAPNQEAWDGILELAYENGAPLDLIKMMTWSDDANERAMRLGMTIPQEVQATISANNAETRAEREHRLGLSGGGLNANQQRLVEDKAFEQNEETEAWLREEAFPADNPRSKWAKDEDGKRIRPPFDVNKLSDSNKAEFVRRKLTTENYKRQALGRGPITAAAAKALERGDKAGYAKLQGEVKSLTQGLLTLEDLMKAAGIASGAAPAGAPGAAPAGAPGAAPAVAPPGTQPPASRPNTPQDQAAKVARLQGLTAALETGRDPQTQQRLTPAQRQTLLKELLAMR